jgi:hypothetical protein
MKIFLHVLNTWVLSILIAVLMLFVYEQFEFSPANSNLRVDPLFFLAIFYVMVAGMPSFFISWAFLAIIQKTSYTSYEKLFLWLLAAILSIALNVLILWLALIGEIASIENFFIFWPAYAGVAVTIIVRLKQFFSMINKTTYHETNMV